MARSRSHFRSPRHEQREDLRQWAKAHTWDGLSQDDVAALLTDDWLGQGPIHLDENLSLADLETGGAVALVNARGLLRAAAVQPLHWHQALLEVAELLQPGGAGFVLTDLGNQLLAPERAGPLYARLFRTFFRRFNIAYLDQLSELPDLQDLIPYLLWVWTGPLGAAFTSADLYVQAVLPRRISEDLDRRAAPARLRHLIQTRVLDPLADFGLLEPKSGDEESKELGDVGFRPTALFRRFLRVDIPHRPVAARRDTGLKLLE